MIVLRDFDDIHEVVSRNVMSNCNQQEPILEWLDSEIELFSSFKYNKNKTNKVLLKSVVWSSYDYLTALRSNYPNLIVLILVLNHNEQLLMVVAVIPIIETILSY